MVPAAKVHVSWKVRGSPNNGNFLREELFAAGSRASFPDAKPIVEERSSSDGFGGKASRNDNNTADGPSKEELLMQRMMGKNGGLFGGKTAKKQKDDGSGKKEGKPKWFK